MSAKATCTEAQIRRAIKAVRKEGLPVAGVRPDGTIIIGEPTTSLVPGQSDDVWLDPSRWNKPGTK
jgi:biotin operon repressor